MIFFQQLNISGFRKISKLVLKDLKQFNLIVGRNNVGKTSVLEAIFFLVNPSNLALPVKTNIFRNIDTDGNDFWTSLFHNFNPQQEISLEAKFNNKIKLKLDLTPNFSPSPEFVVKSSEHPSKNQLYPNEEKTTTEVSSESVFQKQIIGLIGSIIEIKNKRKKEYKIKISQRVLHRLFPLDIDEKKSKKKFQPFVEGFFLNSKTYFNNDELANKFGTLIKNKQEKELVDIIQQLEPTIEGLFLNEQRRIVVDDNRFSQRINLNTYGDGLFRIVQILTTILREKNAIVLIDEIENGLDKNSQRLLWQAIFNYGQKSGTQVFATTHSYEMVRNFALVAKNKKVRKKIRLIRIEEQEGKQKAVNFSAQELDHVLAQKWEFR